MKKKIVSLCLVVALIAVAVIGGTLAYFTDTDSATNTFTVGNVDISLTEDQWVAPTAAEPGVAYAKNPVVSNIGANDAWVRVNVTLSDYAAFAGAAEANEITDLATIFAGHDENKWALVGAPVVDEAANTVTYSYYYKTILAPGTNTGALFTSVTIPAAFDNEDMAALGDDFTISITADAIQTADAYATAADAFVNF